RVEISQGCPAGSVGRRRSSRKLLALAVGAMLTLLVSACGGDTEKQAEAAEGQSQQQIASLPEATTYGKIPDAPMDPEPNAPTKGEVLHPTRELTVHDAVDGKPIARPPVKQISSPTWVPVIAGDGDCAQNLLPTRPNGATGWINTSCDAVESGEHVYRINGDVDSSQLDILMNGEYIGEWTVGIGKPETPTPTGRAYNIASIKETVNDYSPIVLQLGYHSDSHE